MRSLLTLVVAVATLAGCAMFVTWRSIPPPGGCDQCHSVPISSNWRVAYRPANISDERMRLAFQTPEYNQPSQQGGQTSSIEMKKVENLRCFECHKSPTPSHRERMGRFHH